MTQTDCLCQEKTRRGLTSIQNSVNASVQQLKEYIKKWGKQTDYSHQKQYRQHKDQKKKNNQETKTGRKTKISHAKIWTWLRKGNFKRETESLSIAAQNNTIRTNYRNRRSHNDSL